MILTVTPNAALDISYHVDELVVHQSHRVTAVHQRAGGKGVNVASVLARMGHPVIATGLVGGAAGEEIRADLEARGVTAQFVVVGGSSRRTVNVVSAAHGDATSSTNPAPSWPGRTGSPWSRGSTPCWPTRQRPSSCCPAASRPGRLAGPVAGPVARQPHRRR